jgi:hypothetical protein
VERRLIGFSGPALTGHGARGVDAGKVGAERLAVAIDQAVRQADPAGHGDRHDGKQDQAVAAGARGGEPLAGSQPLPDMSHFAAEFYECCATLPAPI